MSPRNRPAALAYQARYNAAAREHLRATATCECGAPRWRHRSGAVASACRRCLDDAAARMAALRAGAPR